MNRKQRSVCSDSHLKNRLFTEANTAWDTGNLSRAFTLFLHAANLGDVSSQLDIGYFFDRGLHVKKDRKQALEWYHRAYVQGDAGAANNIGTVYRDLGDTKKMLWWFRRAAAMGDPDVLFDLGKRYETGTGVPRSLMKATLFYRRVLSSKFAPADTKSQAKTRLARLVCFPNKR